MQSSTRVTIFGTTIVAVALLGALFAPLALAKEPYGQTAAPTAPGPYFVETLLANAAPNHASVVHLLIPFTPQVTADNADVLTPFSSGYHQVAVTIPAGRQPAGSTLSDQVDAVELCGAVADTMAASLPGAGCAALTFAASCAALPPGQYCLVENPTLAQIPDSSVGPAIDRPNTVLIRYGQTNNLAATQLTLTVATGAAPTATAFDINLRGQWSVTPLVDNARGSASLVTGPVSIRIEDANGLEVGDRTLNADEDFTVCAVGYDGHMPPQPLGNVQATWSSDGAPGELIGPNPAECITFNGIDASDPPRTITADFLGVDDETGDLTVVAGALDDVVISCAPNPAPAGAEVQCQVDDAIDADGNDQLTDVLNWHAHDANGNEVVVTPDGRFTAPEDVTAGPVEIHAEARSLNPPSDQVDSNDVNVGVVADGLVSFDVTCTPDPAPLGETVDCEAVDGRDQFDNPTAIPAPAWDARDANDGDLGADASGDFSAPGSTDDGPVTVTATVGAIVVEEEVDLTFGPLASITVDCTPDPVVVGNPVECEASGFDGFGNPTPFTALVWTAEDANGDPVAIDTDGNFTAPTDTSLGPITATATDGAVFGDEDVDLDADVLVDITVTCLPNPAAAGSAVDCDAAGEDQHGNPQSTGVVMWTALDGGSNPVVIDASGAFTAPTDVNDGPVTVTGSANAGAISDQDAVSLIAGALAVITVLCTPDPAVVGASVQCTVSGVDAHGNSVGSPAVTWSATDANTDPVAVSAGGVFIAPTQTSKGPVVVHADAGGGITDDEGVALNPDVLDHFDVTCASPITAGDTSACTAAAFDQHNNPRTDVPTAWTPNAGTISGSGSSVTFHAPTTVGTYTVQASLGAANGQDSVQVNPGPLATLVMSHPAASTVSIDADVASIVVTATGTDAHGNAVADGTTVHWELLDPAPANVGGGAGLDVPSSATVGGVASVTLTTSTKSTDDYRVRATNDAFDPTVIRTSARFLVGPGAPHHFAFTCSVGCTEAGDPLTLSVVAQDVFDNVNNAAPNLYAGAKTLTFGGANASPDGDAPTCQDDGATPLGFGVATTRTFASGAATVSCVLYRAESAALTVTDGTIAEDGALNVVVDPDQANKLTVLAADGDILAGACIAYTVQVQDTYGNAQPLGAVTVNLADGAGSGTFYSDNGCAASITDVVIPDAASQATVYYRNELAEVVTLAFTDNGATLVADSEGVTVDPAAAHHVHLTGIAGHVAGVGQTVTVTAHDVFHNVLDSGPNLYAGTKATTFSGAAASPFGNAPQCGGTNLGVAANLEFALGVATAPCSFPKAQAVTLGATDGAISEAATLDFTVDPAAATSLLLTLPGETFNAATGANDAAPTARTAGGMFAVGIRALDAFGNLASSGANNYDGTKQLTFGGALAAFDNTKNTATDNTATAQDFGTLTDVDFTNGVASTDMKLYRRATAVGVTVSDGSIGDTAAAVNVNAATATIWGILSCSPTLNDRSCILQSETVTAAFAATVGTEYSFRAAKFDPYDNIAGGGVAPWTSNGISPAISATGQGVLWEPLSDADGDVTVDDAVLTPVTMVINVT